MYRQIIINNNVIPNSRYSGEMRELGITIDEGANWLWDNVSIQHTAKLNVL